MPSADEDVGALQRSRETRWPGSCYSCSQRRIQTRRRDQAAGGLSSCQDVLLQTLLECDRSELSSRLDPQRFDPCPLTFCGIKSIFQDIYSKKVTVVLQ